MWSFFPSSLFSSLFSFSNCSALCTWLFMYTYLAQEYVNELYSAGSARTNTGCLHAEGDTWPMSVTNVPLYVANGTDYNWRHSLTYGVQVRHSTTYLASRHHGYCGYTHNSMCILLECSAISKVQVITPPPYSILPRHNIPQYSAILWYQSCTLTLHN